MSDSNPACTYPCAKQNDSARRCARADRPSRLKEGSHKLDLWPNREGDGSTATTTPSKSVATEEAHRRDKLLKLFEEGGNVAHVDWLDRAAMEALQEQSKVRA